MSTADGNREAALLLQPMVEQLLNSRVRGVGFAYEDAMQKLRKALQKRVVVPTNITQTQQQRQQIIADVTCATAGDESHIDTKIDLILSMSLSLSADDILIFSAK